MTVASATHEAGTKDETIAGHPDRRRTPRSEPALEAAAELGLVSATADLMGGSVAIHLAPVDPADPVEADRARADAIRQLARIGAWADRLSRFLPTSDLSRLNDDPRSSVPVRPTLAALLDWGRQAEGRSHGSVDIALLDARLAAESGETPPEGPNPDAGSEARGWSVDRLARGSRVRRGHGLRFDLDGVAKGWLADRAIGRLGRYPAVVVDADGDIAIRLGPGRRWRFGVADPRTKRATLVELDLAGPSATVGRSFGLATSGTSIHRWVRDGRATHHLIDPRTQRPAVTDVVQATVLASSSREAELLAKTAVILGSDAALGQLDGAEVDGAILLTERGELLLTPGTLRWLA